MNEPSSEHRQVQRINWHQLLGKDFDLVFTPLGLEILLEEFALSESPRVDIVILRRDTPEWTMEQYALLPDGIRQSKARHVLLEHKQTESINLKACKQALIYDELYPLGHHLRAEEVQTFIISARTPTSATLQECSFEASEIAGVYRSHNPYARRLSLLSLNEMEPTLHNAFVQCFASKRRVRDTAFKRLLDLGWERMSVAFWDFLFGLSQTLQIKGDEMKSRIESHQVTAEMVMERGRELRKLWLANLSAEELALLPPEKRLAGLAPEDRLAGLAPEDRLAGLAPEEMVKLLEQIEAFLQQQNTSSK